MFVNEVAWDDGDDGVQLVEKLFCETKSKPADAEAVKEESSEKKKSRKKRKRKSSAKIGAEEEEDSKAKTGVESENPTEKPKQKKDDPPLKPPTEESPVANDKVQTKKSKKKKKEKKAEQTSQPEPPTTEEPAVVNEATPQEDKANNNEEESSPGKSLKRKRKRRGKNRNKFLKLDEDGEKAPVETAEAEVKKQPEAFKKSRRTRRRERLKQEKLLLKQQEEEAAKKAGKKTAEADDGSKDKPATEPAQSPKVDKRKQKLSKLLKTADEEETEESKQKEGEEDLPIRTASSNKPKQQTSTDDLKSKLLSSRFRYINEQMYTNTSETTIKLFRQDPSAFPAYHDGFLQQVEKWPVKPLDIITKWVKTKSPKLVVADMGCGEAFLAQNVKNTVHSFDLVALNKHVTVADISSVPLEAGSVDIVVFCLSLMGTNLVEYVEEANRILREDGVMKVAEVASRFRSPNKFVTEIAKFGFKCLKKNVSFTHFYLFDFAKTRNTKAENLNIDLTPCLYKKR